ncbi:RelA/SpoT domain-containing protein [soil metagenome]
MVVEIWRAGHRPVLNTFQALLRTRARGKRVVVAQRHKRKHTIFDKLQRLPGMELARMDDIAGCRLIFPSQAELASFRSSLHAANFRHRRRNDDDKYDYIKNPKDTGYRGIHDIYEYDVNSESGKGSKGLYIELQYRTGIQHAWATAVEMIGVITDNHPKFQQGDKRYEEIMSYASEILARSHENQNSCHPTISDDELLAAFLRLDDDLNLMTMLRKLNARASGGTEYRNMILISSPNAPLDIRPFRNGTDALKALFELEREDPNRDVVLVRADTSAEAHIAFRNYFTDPDEFIRLTEEGCQKLSGKSQVMAAHKPRRRKVMQQGSLF